MKHKDYENKESLQREEKAFNTFINDLKDSFPSLGDVKSLKLGKFDLDYIVEFENGKRLTVEIKGVKIKTIDTNFPPIVSIKKLYEMQRTVNEGGFDSSFIIFAYEDGILYQQLKKLSGTFNWFERKEKRKGLANDNEIILYFTGTEFIKKLY